MISAKMIERLLNVGFTQDMILKVINADYISKEEALCEEMHDAMMSLQTQCAVRKITESLKK
jgi:hypothetical protein